MSTLSLAQLTLAIDSAINPYGGEPLIEGPALNHLLHELVDTLAGATATGRDEYLVSAALRTEVVQGSYNASGELTSALSGAGAAESAAGQCFSFGPATYTYLPGDAGTLTWVRNFKGGGGAAPATTPSDATTAAPATPGLEVLAVGYFQSLVSANGFNTVALVQPYLDLRPTDYPSGWDANANAYVAPLSGTYELLANMRIHDSYGPVGSSYALAAGPDNVDGAWVLWNTIFNVNGGANRKGLQVTRVLHLAAGQAVRMYTYLDGFEAVVFGELTVKLLRRDDPPSVSV